jgi:hypothetical protein
MGVGRVLKRVGMIIPQGKRSPPTLIISLFSFVSWNWKWTCSSPVGVVGVVEV